MDSNTSGKRVIVISSAVLPPKELESLLDDRSIAEDILITEGVNKDEIIAIWGSGFWAELVDAMVSAWEEFRDKVSDSLSFFNSFAVDVAEVQTNIDKRAAERKRWGHPPKSLHTSYSQPMKKIRPSARSRIRQRSGRRRA